MGGLRLPVLAAAVALAVGAGILVEAGTGPPVLSAAPGPGTGDRGAGHPALVLFRDGPPARVTGGFGEDSCHACHWEGKENDGAGSLRVEGFPASYEPGADYPLQVELERPGMRIAGFQLTTRFADDTTQAGALEPAAGSAERVGLLTDREVQFAQHLLPGTVVDRSDTAGWEIVWSAPTRTGAVLLHVSAVAGDGDESQMGDYVYTLEAESRPAGANVDG